jgi:hypothetical protein
MAALSEPKTRDRISRRLLPESSTNSVSHRIYPHGELQQVGPNVWQVEGRLALPVPRNMTVFRTAQGHLVLYSVVAMNDAGMRSLEALGTPAVMIIPHRRHQLDAPFYKARYPALEVIAPNPAVVRRVSVDHGLERLGAFDANAYVLPGNDHEDVVLEMPLGGGSERALCVCESLSNVAPRGLLSLLKLFGPPGNVFGVARGVRWREIAKPDALRAWLRAQAARDDIAALLLGHGPAITHDVSAMLRLASTQI